MGLFERKDTTEGKGKTANVNLEPKQGQPLEADNKKKAKGILSGLAKTRKGRSKRSARPKNREREKIRD